MKRITLIAAIIVLMLSVPKPAAAQNRYIIRSTGGLSSVLNLCNLLQCQVQGGLDGQVGQTFLVTSTNNLLANLVNGTLNLVESLFGIVSVEADRLLPIPQRPLPSIPSGLYDTAPVNYYGTIVWHGYAAQPAAQIIRLQDAQNGFRISGTGIVAVIDTGVDVNHPVLQAVLLPGYDFTRNQPGASEWLDVSEFQNGYVDTGSQDQDPGYVQQSTAAVLDQSTAAVLDGPDYTAFGHGTMTSGLVHLVAPKAQILPLKAFSSNGTGYLSNIVAALYYATQHHANVVNMSFDLTSNSPSLTQAVSYANKAGVVLVAAAGNENTSAAVYPAALNNYVVGIASTTNYDTRSSFSNYGSVDVLIAAPGEYVVSTFPGGTYASASGTSFSSPLVAGTAALMLSARSSLTQNQAANALSHAVELTPDLNHGRLDVYQAVSAWVNSSGSSSGSGSGSCLLFCN
ncbi:MAG TPA: S8 family serine peptidase [Candidatus Acidoferrum sp.]|jgi:subtilisin family serine protease|nr:S8 family serine peptidase [Candidatus Acidoferrum sp.]